MMEGKNMAGMTNNRYFRYGAYKVMTDKSVDPIIMGAVMGILAGLHAPSKKKKCCGCKKRR